MGNVSALQWYVDLFKKYKKPIWLTEFANWENNPTLTDQKNFLVGAVDYLENDPDVFRYAWFTGRFTGAPYIGILKDGESGKLTELGDIYVNMPLHDPLHYVTLPARIEAENYNQMSGVLLELTSDVSGFANVGYIDANDWLEYGIDVPEDGMYHLTIRAAANQQASMQLTIDGEAPKNIIIPSTGGWQTWSTVNETIAFTTGKHILRLKANTGGFNLNWFQLTNEIILSAESREPTNLIVYPNPTNGKLNVISASPLQSMEILTILGERKYKGNSSVIDMDELPAGTYILHVTSVEGDTSVRKIMKR